MAKSLLEVLQDEFRRKFGPHVIVDVFRHGHAGKADPDFQRQLSEQGRAQARALGAAIANVPYDMVLCSPAPRAIHTGLIAICESRLAVTTRLHVAQGVRTYAPSNQAMYDEVFRITDEVGNLKYLDYRAADKMGCFEAFQAEALETLLGFARGSDVSFAVFNHGVMGSFIAEAVLGALTEVTPEMQEVLNTECPPCGCFRVNKNGVLFLPPTN